MDDVRLASVDPALADGISKSSSLKLATLTRAIAEWIVVQVPVNDPRLEDALRALGDRNPDDQIRARLWSLVEELDERAWSLQGPEMHMDTDAAYTRAFGEARAANAIWCALASPLTWETTADCVYEAQASRGDLDGVKGIARQVL